MTSSRGLGETDSSLRGHKQNSVHAKTQRRGAVTPQQTEPKIPASVGGPPLEALVGKDSPQGWDWKQLPGKVPFDVNSLGGCH